jgi:hypothetical protein
MSTQEIQTLAQQFADAFNKKDIKAVLASEISAYPHRAHEPLDFLRTYVAVP